MISRLTTSLLFQDSEDLRTIQGESDSRTGGDTPSEMIAGRPNDATANALTKSDREFSSKVCHGGRLEGDLTVKCLTIC